MSSNVLSPTLNNQQNDLKHVKKVDLTDESLKENIKKKRLRDEARVERKRLEHEEYTHQLHERQYKRLVHLLNRSQFYSKYILDKIGQHRSMRNVSEDVRKRINVETDKLNISADEEDALFKEPVNQTEQLSNTVIETPKYFVGELRDYQKAGFQWLKVLYENGINGILADEMGLGKTIQVIAMLCHLIEKKQDGPYLIVAPLTTVPNWMMEFERFAPKLPVVLFHGSREERLPLRSEIKRKHMVTAKYSTFPIVVTSFETPLSDAKFILSMHWRYIIVDEAQRIKNHECQLIRCLKQCKSMNRLLLTGTPLQNNLAELWSLLNFLLPEIFDDLGVFESWFDAKQLEYDEGTKQFLKLEQEKHVLSSLREILKPFMLRRVKADVCLDLPAKKEIVVYAPMTELQLDLYKAVINRDVQRLSKIKDEPIVYEDGCRPKRRCVLRSLHNIDSMYLSRLNSHNTSLQESDESTDDSIWKEKKHMDYTDLSFWSEYTDVTERNRDFLVNIHFQNRLVMYKKIVNHPFLIHCPLGEDALPKVDEDLVKASGKLLVLDAMLPKLKQQGHKVLIFSTMTMILDMLEDYLSLRDYTYVRLDGATKIKQRTERMKDFNTDPNIFLFLISTRAGGVGVNLVAADTVIVYDCDWNPQMDIQAMARCHRIGQTRPVVVYKLCTKGTIDEAIINRAEAKRILEKMVISKNIQNINIKSKETVLVLQKLLESKEYQIVTCENEVFTEDELDKLLDRSDLYATPKES